MAWVDGIDLTTGDLVTEADWNNYMGGTGSLEYLKTEADKLNTCTHTEQTASRAIDTNYQNGSKIRFVSVQADDGETSHWHLKAYIGSTNPASIKICEVDGDTDYNHDSGVIFFMVPPEWYYRVYEGIGGNFSLEEWHEWDLH